MVCELVLEKQISELRTIKASPSNSLKPLRKKLVHATLNEENDRTCITDVPANEDQNATC